MKFETTRFGSINVKPEDVYIFPEGILGFPDCTKFTFIDEEGTKPFRMLQSLDNPNLAFVVVNPLIARKDFQFDVTRDQLATIKSESIDNLVVYGIVTMAAEIQDITLNLQGPLVFNPQTQLAKQFVLVDTKFTTREPLIQDGEDFIPQDQSEPQNIVRARTG